jgi:hypothetical protein
MTTKPTFSYKLPGILFLIGILSALFLPFLQTETDGMQREPYRFISQYHTQDGFLTTYNGFGSFCGILNAGLSALLVLISFLFGIKSKPLVLTGFILCLLSHLLLLLDQIAAPYLLSEPDKFLGGYFLFTLSEIGLFFCLFKTVKRNKSSSDELLDHPQ